MASPWTLRARWVFPVDRPPIPNGTVAIAGDRIIAVEPAGRREADIDLGDVAVLPGLVNAHTHLDLGELRGRLPASKDFTQWLRAVVAYRRSSSPAAWNAAVRAGAEECLRSGTTLVGDIAAGGVSAATLSGGPIRSTVYYELIGLTKQRAKQSWRDLTAWLALPGETVHCRRGVSPHAPYTVRRGLFRLAGRTSRVRQLPLAVHLAESLHELELLESGAGPLRRLLEDLGAWDEGGLAPHWDWIRDELARACTVAFIHGNYLQPQSCQVVYCPRTHAYFGHPPHPLTAFLAAGGTVALGTDSLASNPDLSMLEELRFVHRLRPDLDGALLLRMATLQGALVLGWGNEAGSLSPGKLADLCVIPILGNEAADPHRLVLDSDRDVSDVCIGGRWLVRSGARVPGR